MRPSFWATKNQMYVYDQIDIFKINLKNRYYLAFFYGALIFNQ